jgi:hypothetical protein
VIIEVILKKKERFELKSEVISKKVLSVKRKQLKKKKILLFKVWINFDLETNKCLK